MNIRAYGFPIFVSTALHLGVLSSGILHHNTDLNLATGSHPITLNIVSSRATESSGAMSELLEADSPIDRMPTEPIAPPAPLPGLTEYQQMISPEIGDVPDKQEEAPAPLAKAVETLKEPVPKRESKPHAENSLPDETRPQEMPDVLEPATEPPEAVPNALARVEPIIEGYRTQYTQSPSGAPTSEENKVAASAEGNTSSPAKITWVAKPKYPRYSRVNGEEGTVVLAIEILSTGKPGKIEIITSSGYQRLDRAALKAFTDASFVPAKAAGKEVASTKRIAFRFYLEDWKP